MGRLYTIGLGWPVIERRLIYFPSPAVDAQLTQKSVRFLAPESTSATASAYFDGGPISAPTMSCSRPAGRVLKGERGSTPPTFDA